MKILIFGAGVLGCNLANNLFRAKKDVTLLARGKWAEKIKNNGLRIKNKFSPRMSVSRIPVVTELKPEDQYDVIFLLFDIHKLKQLLILCVQTKRKILSLSATMCVHQNWLQFCQKKMLCLLLRLQQDIEKVIM